MMLEWSRGSSVSVVTRLWAGRQGFSSWQEQWWNLFLFATPSRSALGPPSILSSV